MATYWATLSLFAVTILPQMGRATRNDWNYNECNDQQEVCECNLQQTECRFRLEIEELQTFTSYKLKEGEVLNRGTPGDVYFIDEAGFHPSVTQTEAPDHGPCWNDMVENIDQFRDFNCSIPMFVDGRTYRTYIAVNGQIPGPTLIVHEDQTVFVDVYNKLTSEGVTVHWHGMHQRNSPWMDGVGFVSQAPITPGAVFRYKFTASPPGTHWYHSHLGAQRTDGLFGALVIHEKSLAEVKEKLGEFKDIPSQHTMTLLDFQREDSLSLFVQINSVLGFYPNKPLSSVPRQSDMLYYPRTLSADGVEVGPIPYWSGLINGRGRFSSETFSPLSVFSVQPNEIYRFRLVGAQNLYAFKVEIVGHKLTTIASDGHFIEPVEVDYIIVHTGERYDFLLSTSQTPDNYMIRAQTLETDSHNTPFFLYHTAEAVLHYNTSGVPQPNPWTHYSEVMNENRTCTSQSKCKAINCPFKDFPDELNIECVQFNDLRALIPSRESDLPRIDNKNVYFLNFGFEGQSLTSAINGKNFVFPPTPYQTYPGQYGKDKQNRNRPTCEDCKYDETKNTTTDNCRCIHTIQIPGDENIMLVLSAVGDRQRKFNDFSHPIHLHGHSFFVVHIEHGVYNTGGQLIENSKDVLCSDPFCLTPSWRNGTPPDLSRYLTDGKLNNTAVRKDTLIVPAGGYALIAFLSDNPGYWFLHCHMEPHQLEGMAVIIQEYPDDKQPKPPLGINNIGDFLEPEEQKTEPTPVNGWMIGCIACIVAVIATILLAVCVIICLMWKM